ncbi:MAG: hypothetical protein HXS54_06115 [Theionarchaea archaeon]|nr:hypothetical protein [Theionarchaea archaeon]DBA34834.1 TPA_asm: hypothetical protein vir521_00040 [Caudoviricetes sp. vir521]
MRTVEKISFSTPRDEIEKGRVRLLNKKESNAEWWENERRSEWARRYYGPTLTEVNAEEFHATIFNNIICQLCGEKIGIDEQYLILTFTFHDEYTCDISMHITCPYLQGLIEKEVKT